MVVALKKESESLEKINAELSVSGLGLGTVVEDFVVRRAGWWWRGREEKRGWSMMS